MHTVLIIDDDASTLKTAATCLRLDGYEVSTAESGSAGIALGLAREFDVILLDLRLPDMSGVDVIRSIRARNLQSRLIVITAFPDVDSSFDAGRLGADGYVAGPLFGEDLGGLVYRAIHARFPIRRTTREPANAERSILGGIMEPRVQETVRIIRAELGRELTAQVLARRVGLSASRLQHLFLDYMGTSLHRYVLNCRLQAAARILAESAEHVRQVAYRVGFADAAHFRQLFRDRFGVSPRNYRQVNAVPLPQDRVQPKPPS